TLFAATLLLFAAGFSAPIAWAQLPTAGSNTSRRPVPQPAPAEPAAPAAAAQSAPSTETRYLLCSAVVDPKNAYYSAPFTGQPPEGSSWAGEFAKFLKQKYNYDRYVSCNSLASLAAAVAALNSAIRRSHQPGAA